MMQSLKPKSQVPLYTLSHIVEHPESCFALTRHLEQRDINSLFNALGTSRRYASSYYPILKVTKENVKELLLNRSFSLPMMKQLHCDFDVTLENQAIVQELIQWCYNIKFLSFRIISLNSSCDFTNLIYLKSFQCIDCPSLDNYCLPKGIEALAVRSFETLNLEDYAQLKYIYFDLVCANSAFTLPKSLRSLTINTVCRSIEISSQDCPELNQITYDDIWGDYNTITVPEKTNIKHKPCPKESIPSTPSRYAQLAFLDRTFGDYYSIDYTFGDEEKA